MGGHSARNRHHDDDDDDDDDDNSSDDSDDTSTQDHDAPAGLKHLAKLDTLNIKWHYDYEHVFCGIVKYINSYDICNSKGEKCYTAHEDNKWIARICLHENRPFTLDIRDLHGKSVLKIQRYWRWTCCLCCALGIIPQKVVVELPDDQELGRVYQMCTCCKPWLRITNEGGTRTINFIKGPFCEASPCCRDLSFKILDLSKSVEVGKIAKNFCGVNKEVVRNADNFYVTFPPKSDVKTRAVILGAAFLVDFMYYEIARRRTVVVNPYYYRHHGESDSCF